MKKLLFSIVAFSLLTTSVFGQPPVVDQVARQQAAAALSTVTSIVQPKVISSNVTLAIGGNYVVDTTAVRSLTLPPLAGLIGGQSITLRDLTGLASTNGYVLTASGTDKINGATSNGPVTVQRTSPVIPTVGAGATTWYID